MLPRLYQAAFTAGVLGHSLYARVDLAKWGSGARVLDNIFVHPHGGASNRAGLQFVGEVKTLNFDTRLFPFEFNGDQAYILEFGHMYIRFWRDGGLIMSGGAPYEVATSILYYDLSDLVITQEADVMYVTHFNQPPHKLSRFADANWVWEQMTFAPHISPPTTLSINAIYDPATVSSPPPTEYYYIVSAVSEATGEESLPSNEISCLNDLTKTGSKNVISWDAVAGAARYIIYKFDNGAFGYIGGSNALSFADDNITADLADAPQSARNPFVGAGNYPRCSTFVDQRLAFAGTLNVPQGVWLSQSANYENFGVAVPAKASDAVTFKIRSRKLDSILSMLPARGLMIMTSGSEWVATGGTQSDVITPTAIRVDNHGWRGSSKVQPITVGSSILFAQSRGGVVRDFSYEFSQDSFVARDLTVMARDIFQGKSIVSWAYAQAPYSIVWVVLDDWSLASLTLMKEHEVWAWTTHQSAGGRFESVVVIPENGEDVPYFIVRRLVGGVWRRYIERLHARTFDDISDAFFVDSGLSYAGAPTKVVTGLDHLEGQTVVALADGNVLRNLTVTGGAVTLPISASKVHVGLSYAATIETLDLDLGQVQGLGSVQGRRKSVPRVTLRVDRSRGLFVGPRESDLVEWKQRADEAWGAPTRMFTGDVEFAIPWEWNTHGRLVVKQNDPLPMTILAVMPDVAVGG